ncbi:MAG: ABC transporter substrate-binding protein [Burkholderiales bacterium]
MRVAFARSPPRLRRIAFLGPYAEPLLWIEPLEERGWVEGRNLVVERRVTNGIEGLAGAARAIAAAEFDVIVTDGTDAARAANEATARIPIVMAAVGDPVGAGLVESLARPGGNLTGYSIQATETTVKRAQLVRELLPSAQKVMVVMDASNAIYPALRQKAEEAYRSLGIESRFVSPATPAQFADMIGGSAWRFDAIEIDPDAGGDDATVVMRAVLSRRVPAIVASRPLLDRGAVVYFDVDRRDQGKRVAAIIDKVLRGAPPSAIPVEQPASFVVAINMRSAVALGVNVPQSLLLRADEVLR